MPRRPGQAEPDVRQRSPRRRVHTVVAGDTLASLAYREYGDPTLWRPLAAFNGIDDPLRLPPGATLLLPAVEDLLGRWLMTMADQSATLPGRDRRHAAAGRHRGAAGRPRTSTTACGCPTCSCCGSATRTASVLAKSERQDRLEGRRSRSTSTRTARRREPLITGEVTALEAEFDATGTFTVIRGYDQAHRLFRGRRTETYTQITASDVVDQGRPAGRAARSATVESTTHRLRPPVARAGVTDWEFLDGLAREIGYEVAVQDGKFDFRAPEPADGRARADGPTQTEPAGAASWAPTCCGSGRGHLGRAGQGGEVRGWDVAQKKALVATAPADDQTAAAAGHDSPADLAKTFGDPVYVATDVAVPHPGRGRRRGEGAGRADRRRVRRVRGRRPRQPEAARRTRRSRSTTSARRSTASTRSPPPGTATTRPPATPRTFAVTGRQERSLFGLASGGGRRPAPAGRGRSPRSATPTTRRTRAG